VRKLKTKPSLAENSLGAFDLKLLNCKISRGRRGLLTLNIPTIRHSFHN